MTIKEVIDRMLKQRLKPQVVVGKVTKVDTSNMVCDIEVKGKPKLYDVRLRSVANGTDEGVLVTPKTGSYVLVGLINNREESAFVCGYSEVEKIRLITKDIELGSDAFGGLVKVEELTKKLNELEKGVNQLVMEFNSHTHIVGAIQAPAGVSVTSVTPIKPSSLTLIETSQSEIENKNVKHGN